MSILAHTTQNDDKFCCFLLVTSVVLYCRTMTFRLCVTGMHNLAAMYKRWPISLGTGAWYSTCSKLKCCACTRSDHPQTCLSWGSVPRDPLSFSLPFSKTPNTVAFTMLKHDNPSGSTIGLLMLIPAEKANGRHARRCAM